MIYLDLLTSNGCISCQYFECIVWQIHKAPDITLVWQQLAEVGCGVYTRFYC